MPDTLSKKQVEFILGAKAKWNIAHGPVRSGKTVGSLFAFMMDAANCPDSDIYIVGHNSDTAYRNVIKLLTESEELGIFRPFCNWSGKKLYYRDKTITVLGAKDESAIGNFYGNTHSLTYCDEIVLYPDSIIDMIDTRLSRPYSKAYATTNPSYPDHKIKQWIDKAAQGDKSYYALQFMLDDNPFLTEDYKSRIRNSLSGIFYKRNYLGLWCMAEGAIFDFFDKALHVKYKPPAAAEYFIAGIDYGAANPFACVLLGVSTGKYTQSGKVIWVEDEYYWAHKEKYTKTNAQLCQDVVQFLEPYNVNAVYIDPSAASFKAELRRVGIHPVDANNEVLDGIGIMTSMMQQGNLFVMDKCKNLINEIEKYVWDDKKSKRGDDEPIKKADHCVDALRYCVATHKISTYQPYKDKERNEEWQRNKYQIYRK